MFAKHDYETFKCLFTIHELLKYLFAMNYEKKKSLFAIHELWKYPFETHE